MACYELDPIAAPESMIQECQKNVEKFGMKYYPKPKVRINVMNGLQGVDEFNNALLWAAKRVGVQWISVEII